MLFQCSMELSILFHDCSFFPYGGRIGLPEALQFLFQVADVALLTLAMGSVMKGI